MPKPDSDLILTAEVMALIQDAVMRKRFQSAFLLALSGAIDELRCTEGSLAHIGGEVRDPRLNLEDACRFACIMAAEPLDASLLYRRVMPMCEGDDGCIGNKPPAEHFLPEAFG